MSTLVPVDAGKVPENLPVDLAAILSDPSIPVNLRLAHLRSAANDRLSRSLEKAIVSLESLIAGAESVEEHWVPANLIMVGNVMAFPNGGTELVMVRKVVKRSAPDKTAITYLMDRVLGSIAQNVNVNSTSLVVSVDGKKLSEVSDNELAQLYSEKVKVTR